MGVSAFAFVEGAMNRLKERKEAKQKAEQELALEDKKYEIWQNKLVGPLAAQAGYGSQLGYDKLKTEHAAMVDIDKQLFLENRNSFFIDEKGEVVRYNPFDPATKSANAQHPQKGARLYNLFNKKDTWFSDVMNLSNLDDEEKTKINTALLTAKEKGTLYDLPFMQNFYEGLGEFNQKNVTITEQGESILKRKIPNTGIAVIDDLILGRSVNENYLAFNRAKNNSNNTGLKAWKNKDNTYEIGPADDESLKNAVEGSIINVSPVLFASSATKDSFTTKDGSLTKTEYMGIDLYDSLNSTGFNRNTSNKFHDMASYRNNPNYTLQSYRGTYQDVDEPAFTNENKEKYGDTFYGNKMLAENIVAAYLEKDWNFDGQAYRKGPNRSSEDSEKTLQGYNTQIELISDFMNKLSLVFDTTNESLRLRDLGGIATLPNSIGERVAKLFTNLFPTGEDPSSAYASQGDAVLGALVGEDGSIKIEYDSDMSNFLGTDGLIDLNAYYASSKTNKNAATEARSIFGKGLFEEKVTLKQFEDLQAELREFDDIANRIRLQEATTASERRKAALIAMAYTFASFIQGGASGTRTVSDADVIFALKALGAINEEGKFLNTASNLGQATVALKDRATEMTKRVLPSLMIGRNENFSRVDRAEAALGEIVGNFDRDQLLNLMGYFGENVQDSVYNLDFEMNRSNVYENPSEREKFFATAYRDEKQQAALQEEFAEFTREGVGDYNTMSESLQTRYNNLRGFLEKNVDNRFLDQEEKDTIKDQLNILKTLR